MILMWTKRDNTYKSTAQDVPQNKHNRTVSDGEELQEYSHW